MCGARRLAAVKLPGWRTVHVWIRPDLSANLRRLMAEHDDVATHLDYNPVEKAALFTEYMTEMAADAAGRQAASRASETRNPRWDGVGKLPTPCDLQQGRAGDQAAELVGGSRRTLEKIVKITEMAEDESRDPELRRQAQLAILRIADEDPVDPLFVDLMVKARLDDQRVAADADNPIPEARDAAKHALQVFATQKKPLDSNALLGLATSAVNRVKRIEKRLNPVPDPPKVTIQKEPKKKTVKTFL